MATDSKRAVASREHMRMGPHCPESAYDPVIMGETAAKARKSVIASAWDFAIEHWLAIATAVVGAVMGYLARITLLLQAFAPVSYGFAVLLAALFAMLLFAAYARTQLWLADRHFREILATPPTSVNPLRPHFDGERIRVSDFYSPLADVNKSKAFSRCQIVGPGTVVITPSCTINVARFLGCDIVAMRPGAVVGSSVVAFQMSTFTDCVFIGVTVFMAMDHARHIVDKSVTDDGETLKVIGLNC
jgi:hypothetical protein